MAIKFNPLVKRGFDDVGEDELTEAEANLLYLKLDQTTPQTVENGQPTFEGIKIKAGEKLILDA